MYNYKQLGWVIKYIRWDQETLLDLEVDNKNVTKWWVDASFAVHSDRKIHTGSTMSPWHGIVIINIRYLLKLTWWGLMISCPWFYGENISWGPMDISQKQKYFITNKVKCS